MKVIARGTGLLTTLLALLAAVPAFAHVGSPDVFYDGMAGPYRVLVAIRPPGVIPGTAQVEVRTSDPGVRSVQLLPMPLSGPGNKFPPTADRAGRSSSDPALFTGQLWLMDFGSWQVKVSLQGDRGKGAISVPVPALATQTRSMDAKLGVLLFGLMVFLVFGLVSITGAAVREATLPAGAPSAGAGSKSKVAMVVAVVILIGALYGGNRWWASDALKYSRNLYQPLSLKASVGPGHKLDLLISDSGWVSRRLDDLVPDHDHIMHLYAIREPDMNAVFHLHPEQVHTGAFELALPSMPRGRYKLFADIVHESGLGETAVGEIQIADSDGAPLTGDNAGGPVQPGTSVSPLPDGTRMVWVRGPEPVRAGQVQRFVFRIEDSGGHPLTDLDPYMGMAGHAAFVRRDFSTFAHVHPVGSAPMPAMMLAASQSAAESLVTMHQMPAGAEVSFPYAFPAPGSYRIFVQIKRGGQVQTGAFDAEVR